MKRGIKRMLGNNKKVITRVRNHIAKKAETIVPRSSRNNWRKLHKIPMVRKSKLDKQQKERQAQIDNRMRELVAEGYSLREAETIVGNEELMRYE